jgi:valyl-tRNA synthetase
MEKTFDPKLTEETQYQNWETKNYFSTESTNSPYCIVLPPPNVTGSLHMGHGFQQTLMDVLIRYHRMKGDNTRWVVGTDHAGIATQMVVERQLNAKGQSKEELGREAFIKQVWEWKEQSGNTITKQMRRLGVSADWSREHFTMDADLSHAVFTAFEKLHADGLIYKGTRLVNWDPVMQTAVSDLEVVNETTEGKIYSLRYPLASDPSQHIIVATTRPETMLGDTAVAVNPEDPRYQHLIGQKLILPLANREIPIVADSYADPAFGTGCVKITPAHDFNDYALGQRHGLPLINIFTKTAHLNENVPAIYQGLERFAARKKILADLEALHLIEEIKPHTLQIPRNERGNEILEPFLTEQWYVKMSKLAEVAMDAVKKGNTEFIPENWSKTYFQWLENIQDWCISRQLWWGHRIPVFYDATGKIYIAESDEHARQKYQLDAKLVLTQDNDVLDTWFSSALWPFSTLGWPNKTADLETFYPTSVLVTGFDIIFFWVARMMMFGLYFTGKIPFRKVYITGLIRDEKGQKMSKTKGNVLDPIDLIDGIDLASLVEKRTQGLMQPQMKEKIEKATRKEFPSGIPASGTDALRFTYCALATNGRDIRFDLGRLEGYRNFTNKIWNATKFVLMNTSSVIARSDSDVAIQPQINPSLDCFAPLAMTEGDLINRWINSKLALTIKEVRENFDNYRFDLASQTIYDFIWHDYCDWYLELSKSELNRAELSENQKTATRFTLLHVLEVTLRLLHPIMPFITETLWLELKPFLKMQDQSIMIATYPNTQDASMNKEALETMDFLQKIITGVRNIRGEVNISPKARCQLFYLPLSTIPSALLNRIQENEMLLKNLAKLEKVLPHSDNNHLSGTLTFIVEGITFQMALIDIEDLEAVERYRNKKIEKIEQELKRLENKLQNESYAAKAPAEIVAEERKNLASLKEELIKLLKQN